MFSTERNGKSLEQGKGSKLCHAGLKEMQSTLQFKREFDVFCDAFERCFPESELIEREVLRESLREMPFFELLSFRDSTGELVGGAITNVVTAGEEKFGWLPYLFILPERRRERFGTRANEIVVTEACAKGAIGSFLENIDPVRLTYDQADAEASFYTATDHDFTPQGREKFWASCGYRMLKMYFESVEYDTPYKLAFQYIHPEFIGKETIPFDTVRAAILDNLSWCDNAEEHPQFVRMMANNAGLVDVALVDLCQSTKLR